MKNKILSLILIIGILLSLSNTLCIYADTSVTNLNIICTDNRVFPIFKNTDEIKLTITWDAAASANFQALQINITDYFGASVLNTSENVDLRLGKKEINFDNSSKLGHFRITAAIDSVTASLDFSVVKSLDTRRNSDNSQIALSAMSSHSGGHKASNPEEFAETLALEGVKYVREFNTIYGQIKNDGSYLHNTQGKALMDAYKKYGMKILFMIQGSTARLQKDDIVPDSVDAAIPYSLTEAYNYIKSMCDENNGLINAIEILNETDINSNGPNECYGADKYAAFLKAASIAVIDSGINIPIASAAMTQYSVGNYRRILYQNEIQKYIDTFTYHAYSTLENPNVICDFPESINTLTDEAIDYGMGDKQMWLTETGLRIPFEPGKTEPTDEQKLTQARYTPMAMISALYNNTDKLFWFVPGYINESNKTYGTMSQTGEPYSCYNSISACTNIIGNAQIAGKLNNLPIGAEGYYLYDEAMDESVIAVWAKNSSVSVEIKAGTSSAIYCDIMGNEEVKTSPNGIYSLNANPNICYLRFSGKYYAPEYTPRNRITPASAPVSLSAEDRIVIQPDFINADESEARIGGYVIQNNSGTLKANVYNFNDFPIDVKVSANTFGNFNVSDTNTTLHIDAKSMETAIFTLTTNSNTDYSSYKPITISGTYNGKPTTNSVSYVTAKSDIYNTIALSEYNQPSNWSKHATASIKDSMTISNAGEDGIKFRYVNQEGDWWSYPALSISNKNIFINTTGIYFKYKTSIPINDFVLRVYFIENSGEEYTSNKARITTSDDWTVVKFPWSSFRLNAAKENIDGLLNLNDLSILRIGTSVYSQSADVNNFDLYINDLGVIQGNTSDDVINHKQTSYKSGILKAEFNIGHIPLKSVEATINKSKYFMNCTSSSAELNIPLPYGNHSIHYRITDLSNRIFNLSATLNVDEHLFITDTPTYKIGKDYNNNTVGRCDISIFDKPDDMNSLTSIVCNYDSSDRLSNITTSINTLEVNKSYNIYGKFTSSSNKCFLYLWKDLNSLSPITSKTVLNNIITSDYINYKEFFDFSDLSKWERINSEQSFCSIKNADKNTMLFRNYIIPNDSNVICFTPADTNNITNDTKAISTFIKSDCALNNLNFELSITDENNSEWTYEKDLNINTSWVQLFLPLSDFLPTTGANSVPDITKIKNFKIKLENTDNSRMTFDLYFKNFGFVK